MSNFEKDDRVKLGSIPSKTGRVMSSPDESGNVMVDWDSGGCQEIHSARLMPQHTENRPSTFTEREAWLGFTEGESDPSARQ